MHDLEVKSFNPSVFHSRTSPWMPTVCYVLESSPYFSGRSGISFLIFCNPAEAALGLPYAWPPLHTPSLTDDVRGSLAAWRMRLGKFPGVFRHCFWPEKQKHPWDSQGSQSAQGTCCPLLFFRAISWTSSSSVCWTFGPMQSVWGKAHLTQMGQWNEVIVAFDECYFCLLGVPG